MNSTALRSVAVAALLLVATGSQAATTYYLDATAGSDSNAGTSAAAAWRTLAKLNATTLTPGDSILFKRGETFTGTLTINQSGTTTAPITIDAYGTGAKPKISGFTTVTGWTSVDGGVYQAHNTSIPDDINLVTLDGTPQAVGRFPNADAPNQGFLQYESLTGTTGFVDNELTSATNWAGAEVYLLKYRWRSERLRVTNHVGSSITYTATTAPTAPYDGNPTPGAGTPGLGYFFQRDPRTLDQPGEWYFDTVGKNLQLFFGSAGPSGRTVRVSTVQTLLNLGANRNITVSNLAFEGANQFGAFAKDGDGITLQQCDFAMMGNKSVFLFNVGSVLLDGVTSNFALSNGIQITSTYKANVTIRNSTITNSGTLSGMGSFWTDSDYCGLVVNVGNQVLIENNVIRRSGYCGIKFQGNDILIQKNVVDEYDFNLDDGGGIYTFIDGTDAAPTRVFTNRVIRNNIVSNAIGTFAGAIGYQATDTAGIYLDGRSMSVDVTDNTVFNIADDGIYSNNPNTVHITGNTVFNCAYSIGVSRYPIGTTMGLSITNNVFFAADETQRNFRYNDFGLDLPTPRTLQTALSQLAPVNGNFYNTPNPGGFVVEYQNLASGPLIYPAGFSLEGWRQFSGLEATSQRMPAGLPRYIINSTIGTNMVTNGTFATNANSVNTYSVNSGHTAAWDGTSQLTGTGSLKITPTVSENRYVSVFGTVGAISATKKYRLRVSTKGTTLTGQLRAYMRQAASPYASMTPVQTASYGTSRIDHEFLFVNPDAATSAHFMVEVLQSAGITYVDDIELQEVTATVADPASLVKFEYNATATVKTVPLSGSWVDARGTTYSGSIALQPFTSAVLILTSTAGNQAPTVDAGVDQTLTLPVSTATLNGTATDTDGTIATWAWSKVSGSGQLGTNGAPTIQITALTTGTSIFRLTVTDNAGGTASDDVAINVLPQAMSDAGTQVGPDAGLDAGLDAGMDAGADAGVTEADAGVPMTDAGSDAGSEEPPDAGTALADAGSDAGSGAPPDAGSEGLGPVQGCSCQGSDSGLNAMWLAGALLAVLSRRRAA